MAPPPPARSWRELADDAHAALQRQFLGDKSIALYETLGAHALDATTGGVLFFAGITAAQLAQRALHISAATPVVPTVVGAAAVAASSALALHFASLPREIYNDVLVLQQRSRGTEQSLFARMWPSSSSSTPSLGATVAHAQQTLANRIKSLEDAPYPVYMLMGVACFTMLGGRMAAVAPSNVAHLGAFHLRKASLPATAEYATPLERSAIQAFGRLFGCHTCGAKRGVKYHADHMPPKLVAQRKNAHVLRRLTGRTVPFRFYPQCEPCSNQQASAVKLSTTRLRTHVGALRLYHSTGVWLVLLCTGGLYVGGSSFHEMSDVVVPAAAVGATAGQPQVLRDDDSATSERSLLAALRARERRLERALSLAKQRSDASDVAAIDAELDALVQCKAALKTNRKRVRGSSSSSSSP